MSANPYRGPMLPWPGLAPLGRHVSVSGGRLLFVFEAGDAAAPALVLLHGLGDEADSWRHVIQPLAEHNHVIAPDLPGFGRSDPLARYSLPTLRDALLALLDALKLSGVTLVGNSLGAILAQHIAAAVPDRVTGLVLVDGLLKARAAKISWPALVMALPYFGNRIYTAFRRDPQAAYDSLRPFYANLDALPEPDRKFLFQRVNERVWSDSQRRAYLELYRDLAFSAPLQASAVTTALAKLAATPRLIWGELDNIMPIAAARAFISVEPAARLTVIPGAGHLPHQEQPAAFLSALALQPAPQST